MDARRFPYRTYATLLALATFASLASALSFNRIVAQDVRLLKQTVTTGTVTDIKPGEISVQNETGDVATYKIQDKDERAVSLGGRPTRIPAKIVVAGVIPAKLLERGMIVHFFGRTNAYGKSDGEIKNITVLSNDDSQKLEVDFLERPATNRDPGDCEVTGRVINLAGNRLQLQVAKAKWAKNERIFFKLSSDAVIKIDDDHLNHVQPNDKVERAIVMEFSTGERVIKEIKIRLSENRKSIATTFDEELINKFSHLSNEPGDPREVRSDHFVLYTDISNRSSQILLTKLETMHDLVSRYYGARPTSPIECYVVRDLRKWPPGRLPPAGIAKIREPAGVTITQAGNGTTRATVYSCDRHSIVQHEAVHAFCAQTFGATGPVWYAEGMAEMGQYWKPGQRAVDVDSIVISYLTNSSPKKMADIVAAGQITGDSWQAYAWRWALCHLLASNPNYSKRFKTLGLNLMAKRNDSFDMAFGKHADKISFEYDQFVKNFNNGYRVDLCVWDWRTRPAKLSHSARLKKKVQANRGWQATKLLALDGISYDFVTEGTWKTFAGDEDRSADGHPSGNGKLIGAIFRDFQLSEPFELGEKGTFVPPHGGQLFVRCRDSWTSIADNDGLITLFIRRTPIKKEQ